MIIFNQTPKFYFLVVQYGFITLFVASFPLAPLCALIKNILEIRIDSSKMIKYYRRPLAKQSTSIGVWFDTLKAFTNIAVITNVIFNRISHGQYNILINIVFQALFITFTSNFIPSLVYNFGQSTRTGGFIDFTLSSTIQCK